MSNITTTTAPQVNMSGYRTIPAGSDLRGRLLSPREPGTTRGVSAGHQKPQETLVETHGLADVDSETTESSIRLIIRHSPASHQPSPDPRQAFLDSRRAFLDSRHQPADRITYGSTGYPEGRQHIYSYGLSYPPEPSYGGHQLTQPTTPQLLEFRPNTPQVAHHHLWHQEPDQFFHHNN